MPGQSSSRTITGILLSVSLLMGGIAAPTRRHTHIDGNLVHVHHYDDAHEHDAPGHHTHHHSRSDGIGADAAHVTPIATAHVHLCVWLFDLTLPIHSGFQTVDDDSVFLARSTADRWPVTLAGPHGHTRDDPLRGSVCAAPSPPTHGATAPPGPAILLCDSARHERSGTQRF